MSAHEIGPQPMAREEDLYGGLSPDNRRTIDLLRLWGVPVDDPEAPLFPGLFDFLTRIDAALSVFTHERRERLAQLSTVETLSGREAAFVIGAVVEAVGVASEEREGRV